MAGASCRYDDQNAHSYEPCIYPSETGGRQTEAHAPRLIIILSA